MCHKRKTAISFTKPLRRRNKTNEMYQWNSNRLSTDIVVKYIHFICSPCKPDRLSSLIGWCHPWTDSLARKMAEYSIWTVNPRQSTISRFQDDLDRKRKKLTQRLTFDYAQNEVIVPVRRKLKSCAEDIISNKCPKFSPKCKEAGATTSSGRMLSAINTDNSAQIWCTPKSQSWHKYSDWNTHGILYIARSLNIYIHRLINLPVYLCIPT